MAAAASLAIADPMAVAAPAAKPVAIAPGAHVLLDFILDRAARSAGQTEEDEDIEKRLV